MTLFSDRLRRWRRPSRLCGSQIAPILLFCLRFKSKFGPTCMTMNDLYPFSCLVKMTVFATHESLAVQSFAFSADTVNPYNEPLSFFVPQMSTSQALMTPITSCLAPRSTAFAGNVHIWEVFSKYFEIKVSPVNGYFLHFCC